MKQTILLFTISFFTVVSGWTQNNKATLAYVAQYKEIAMKEMKRTGVPASITLAQAIVESNSGESNLAKNHNNHFGIKCKSDWKGAKTYQDDDAKQECFRAYENAEQSFKDHSNFLKSRPNYVDLFLLDPVDDTAWAFGLKKAGYATATDYPKKLLKIIDDYELAQYNFPELANEIETDTATKTITVTDSAASVKKIEAVPESVKTLTDTIKPLNKPAGIASGTISNYSTPIPVKKLPLTTIEAPAIVKTDSAIPKSTPPADTIQLKPVDPTPVYNYPEGRFRINQVPVLLGKKDRSFVEIAIQYNVPLYKLFEYNEIDPAILLERDQLIFLGPKKKEGSTSFHIAKYKTNLHEISQLEGIQLKLLKAYNPKLTDTVNAGTQVLLFKQKENNPTPKKDNSLLFSKKNK
jgi:flagellum-specific peptidoglycan hydrolase FlgJ